VNRGASVEGGERLRLFCALRLPDETLVRLGRWQADELAGRIVPPEHLHVTLAFLGSRPRADVPGVVEVLRAACGAAGPPLFAVRRYRETRSVGMLELEDASGNAAAIAASLHARLQSLGLYTPERRPWLAHVTVLRFRERPRLEPRLPDLGRFSPSDAALYHSVLRPSGAQYDVLESVALGGE
jgi:2'-5' RNA ligase